MKQGARLINAARGDVVDQDALVDALTSGHLGGAGIDVFPTEPVTESPLFGLPGVVVTPHLGASTEEAQDRAGVVVAEQVVAALTGGVVTSAVNIPSVGPEALAVLGPFLPLASQLGQLITAAQRRRPVADADHLRGELATLDTRLLTSAMLAGHPARPGRGAGQRGQRASLAAERGIEWTETTTPRSRDYTNRLTLARPASISLGGTTVGTTSRPRLVRRSARRSRSSSPRTSGSSATSTSPARSAASARSSAAPTSTSPRWPCRARAARAAR